MNNNKQRKNGRYKWYVLSLIICIISIICGISYINNNKPIAKRLTNDILRHGPIEFKNEVYFPSRYGFPEDSNTELLGKIEPKDTNIILDFINQDQIIADKNDKNYTHLKTGGGDDTTGFTKAEFLEDSTLVKEELKEYNKFVLCNDEGKKYIRIPIEKDILLELENRFGEIDYNIEDFYKYDSLYYIFVAPYDLSPTSTNSKGVEFYDEPNFGAPLVYLGCIFVSDNKLYYGNLNNNITGELADKLTSIIEMENS